MEINKVKQIEDKAGTPVFNMALAYLFNRGIVNVKEITEEEIYSVKGNCMMEKSLCVELIRTAKQLAELELFEDLFPYIKYRVSMRNAINEYATLDRSMFSKRGWEILLDQLNRNDSISQYLDYEDVESVDQVEIVCLIEKVTRHME